MPGFARLGGEPRDSTGTREVPHEIRIRVAFSSPINYITDSPRLTSMAYASELLLLGLLLPEPGESS